MQAERGVGTEEMFFPCFSLSLPPSFSSFLLCLPMSLSHHSFLSLSFNLNRSIFAPNIPTKLLPPPLPPAEEPDMEYKVLPWKAKKEDIKSWLIDQGYGACADRLGEGVKEGCHLYALERDTMREMFGAGDGVRLFSQLQKDKQKAEKEGGAAKESAFQVGRREGKKKDRERGTKGRGEGRKVI